jgi:hypothetical protein
VSRVDLLVLESVCFERPFDKTTSVFCPKSGRDLEKQVIKRRNPEPRGIFRKIPLARALVQKAVGLGSVIISPSRSQGRRGATSSR